jgi:hypothetical protein
MATSFSGGSRREPPTILAISWQQNWPFRNYNLITKDNKFPKHFPQNKIILHAPIH